VADEDGNFDWAVPGEEVHTFVNDLERPVGTYLYGRRMYEVMVGWETALTVVTIPHPSNTRNASASPGTTRRAAVAARSRAATKPQPAPYGADDRRRLVSPDGGEREALSVVPASVRP
jgi:hypothetical protein